jgi:carboxylesterase type B
LNNNNNEAGYYRINAFAAGINLTDVQWSEFNDAAFTCPTGAEAANRAAHGVPTWRSRYFGDWPNLRLYPTSGTYHGVDLHMVFGTAQAISGLPNTDAENAFHRYMSSAWVAFATDPVKGLSQAPFNWPNYRPSGK